MKGPQVGAQVGAGDLPARRLLDPKGKLGAARVLPAHNLVEAGVALSIQPALELGDRERELVSDVCHTGKCIPSQGPVNPQGFASPTTTPCPAPAGLFRACRFFWMGGLTCSVPGNTLPLSPHPNRHAAELLRDPGRHPQAEARG